MWLSASSGKLGRHRYRTLTHRQRLTNAAHSTSRSTDEIGERENRSERDRTASYSVNRACAMSGSHCPRRQHLITSRLAPVELHAGSYQYVGVDNDSHARDDSIYDVFHKRTADSSHAGIGVSSSVVAPCPMAVWLRETAIR